MTDDLPAPVASLLAAANAHDADAFVRRFEPDGEVDDRLRSAVRHHRSPLPLAARER